MLGPISWLCVPFGEELGCWYLGVEIREWRTMKVLMGFGHARV